MPEEWLQRRPCRTAPGPDAPERIADGNAQLEAFPPPAQTQVFLDRICQAGRPQMHEVSVPDARRAAREMHLALGPPLAPGVTTRDLVLERSWSEGGQLAGRLYRPAAVPPDQAFDAGRAAVQQAGAALARALA